MDAQVSGEQQATAFGKGWMARDVIPSHKFHFDSDDYMGVDESRAHRRYPLYTCLVYADDGGGYGGATLVLDTPPSRPGSPLAKRAWVSRPSTDYVTCFNGTLSHAVLPGVFPAGLTVEQRKERAAVGQQRRSFNFAFWADEPCQDGPRGEHTSDQAVISAPSLTAHTSAYDRRVFSDKMLVMYDCIHKTRRRRLIGLLVSDKIARDCRPDVLPETAPTRGALGLVGFSLFFCDFQ